MPVFTIISPSEISHFLPQSDLRCFLLSSSPSDTLSPLSFLSHFCRDQEETLFKRAKSTLFTGTLLRFRLTFYVSHSVCPPFLRSRMIIMMAIWTKVLLLNRGWREIAERERERERERVGKRGRLSLMDSRDYISKLDWESISIFSSLEAPSKEQRTRSKNTEQKMMKG